MVMRMHIAENYVRILFIDDEDDRCEYCKEDCELPGYFCPELKVYWHKRCEEKIGYRHWSGVNTEHTDIRVDQIKEEQSKLKT